VIETTQAVDMDDATDPSAVIASIPTGDVE
jgi:hypothetical protein